MQPSSSSHSESFSLLDPRIQRWIWEKEWERLNPAQELAIPLILKGVNDVVIAAATASGKTEAAMLPILTRLLAAPEAPGCVLYISPLKALINDQWDRLERLCASLQVPVTPWHGDISASRKHRFLKRPEGILLITPESLESLLMRQGHALGDFLGGLAYVVIDELHSFIDAERGKQLQSLLHRLDSALTCVVPRIGLSATLGEMRMAAEFLRPGCGERVDIVQTENEGQEIRVLVKGYVDAAPADGAPAPSDEPAGSQLGIAADLFKTLRGANHLVFPNSRAAVELYADLLRRRCEAASLPNEFWPHHGSLSKQIREETEQELREGKRPATAIATTTLELGIDIGKVQSVAQIGPGPSVASLRQRLGRSGRRNGDPPTIRCYCSEAESGPDMTFSDELREGLIQTIAQLQLLGRKWYEPPRGGALHLSTLIQQLLSLIAQYGGITAQRAWSMLFDSGVFEGLTQSEFAVLLRFLGEEGVLMQDSSGLLLHAPLGEQIVNHYTFYAAFTTDEEFRVVQQGRPIGTLPLSRPVDPGSYIILAGRRWVVLSCEPREKLIEVKPAGGGKLPKFDGMSGKVHDQVRAQMRVVLSDRTPLPFLDKAAAQLVGQARSAFERHQLAERTILRDGADVRLLTWSGDWVNDTLALMLTSAGFRSSNEGLSIVVAKSDVQDVVQALTTIANAPSPEPERLVDAVESKLKEKWDHLLPPSLLARNFASRELDALGAHAAAARLTMQPTHQQPVREQDVLEEWR